MQVFGTFNSRPSVYLHVVPQHRHLERNVLILRHHHLDKLIQALDEHAGVWRLPIGSPASNSGSARRATSSPFALAVSLQPGAAPATESRWKVPPQPPVLQVDQGSVGEEPVVPTVPLYVQFQV
ncbi:unnamed protein product [Symbiodinium sp. CCMP2592]|nr:unnamed protein product [Symbiodinium sp. CCMP2592]